MTSLFASHQLADRLPVYTDTGAAFIPGRDPAWFVHPADDRCPGAGKMIRADRVVWSNGAWVAIGTCHWWSKYMGKGHYHECEGEPHSGGKIDDAKS